MQDSYISRQNPLFASADNAFRLELVLEGETQSLQDLDIVVTVYTSQLSPRQQVASWVEMNTSDIVENPPAYISRGSDYFYLVLTPEFQRTLPTGVLTLSVAYSKENFHVTNVIPTEKFINDLAA